MNVVELAADRVVCASFSTSHLSELSRMFRGTEGATACQITTRESRTCTSESIFQYATVSQFNAKRGRNVLDLRCYVHMFISALYSLSSSRAMRPLLGMENYKYAGKLGAASGDADGDDDPSVTTLSDANPATADLMRALQSIHQRTEEDEEDATMDALCKAPGGACALPPIAKKTPRSKPDKTDDISVTATTVTSSETPHKL